jgi:thiamine monophosphate synthase
MTPLPRLYAILDTSCFNGMPALFDAARELTAAGVSLIQYRDKSGDAQIILARARELLEQSRTGVSAPH